MVAPISARLVVDTSGFSGGNTDNEGSTHRTNRLLAKLIGITKLLLAEDAGGKIGQLLTKLGLVGGGAAAGGGLGGATLAAGGAFAGAAAMAASAQILYAGTKRLQEGDIAGPIATSVEEAQSVADSLGVTVDSVEAQNQGLNKGTETISKVNNEFETFVDSIRISVQKQNSINDELQMVLDTLAANNRGGSFAGRSLISGGMSGVTSGGGFSSSQISSAFANFGLASQGGLSRSEIGVLSPAASVLLFSDSFNPGGSINDSNNNVNPN